MAVDEQRLRMSLHARLVEAVGADEAALLMEYLPPVGWADIARQSDLDTNRMVLSTEIASVRTDLTTEIASVRTDLTTEIASVRTDLSTEIASVRTDLSTEIGALRTEMTSGFDGVGIRIGSLRSEMLSLHAEARSEARADIAELKNQLLMWLLPTVVGSVGVAVTLARVV